MRAGFPSIMSAARNRSFLPTNLTGNQLWLDASDLSTITTATGVSVWADKSGNGNNATQGTADDQPATGATTQNGKNILDFDGTETLILPSALYAIPADDSTIFVASKRASEDVSIDAMVGMGEDGVNNGYFLVYSSASGSIIFRNRQLAGTVTSAGNTNTNFNINRGRRSGTTQAVAVNGGTEVTATTATDPTTVDIALIGGTASASLFLIGSIGEIIIYNRSLSTAEIAAVENYLTNKWAIV